jgi:hypothetical protein
MTDQPMAGLTRERAERAAEPEEPERRARQLRADVVHLEPRGDRT